MRGRVGAAVLLVTATISGSGAVGQRLPPECRQQIVQLCRGAQGGFRECLLQALPRLTDECRREIGQRAAARASVPAGVREESYGADPLQKLDLVVPAGAKKTPLLVFVHGGGWSIGDKRGAEATKVEHFGAQGWAVASLNYRLVPQARVEQQAADIASALAWLRANAAERDLDPDRIVLMGHSAGAHLVALVGTDTRYLKEAGVPLSAIRGEVLLDGAGYDIAAQMAGGFNPVAPMYDAAFGKGVARQKALSPIVHAGAPNVTNWLILPVASRADSRRQSEGLAEALRRAGDRATVTPVPDTSHGKLNRQLGTVGDFATARVDAFLSALR